MPLGRLRILGVVLLAGAALASVGTEAGAAWVSTKLNAAPADGDSAGTFEITPNGQHVVFLAGDYDQVLFSVPTGGGVPVRLSAPSARTVAAFTISPDGSRVVYIGTDTFYRSVELNSVPVAGGEVTRLNPPLATGGQIVEFTISPDGSRVAYLADQQTDEVFELYWVPTAGGVSTRLNGPLVAGGDVATHRFAFSPDGLWVVYEADQGTDGKVELYSSSVVIGGWVTKLNGALVAGGGVTAFLVSPMGTRVAYVADQAANDVFELYVAPIEGGAAVRLNAPLVAGGDVSPNLWFSPDGGRLVYVADQETDEVGELFSVALTGGAVTKLNAPLVGGGDVWMARLEITPSGRVVYVADQETDETWELFSVPLAGGAATKLSGPFAAGGRVRFFRISPGGGRVFYIADERTLGVAELFSVPSSGGMALRLNGPLVPGGGVEYFLVSPDGSRIFYAAEQDIDGMEELYGVPAAGGAAVKVNAPLLPGADVFEYGVIPAGSRVVYRAGSSSDRTWELFAAREERTTRLLSRGAEDGWVLESSETSQAGGSLDARATTLRVGDDGLDRQYRSLLSFDTSRLPDAAQLLAATLRLRLAGMTGANAFLTHGKLLVDVRKGVFAGSGALQPADFRAPSSRDGASSVGKTGAGGWYSANLGGAARAFINRTGLTQLRLRFASDDNDDGDGDLLFFSAGDDPRKDRRPVLEIRYALP